MPSRLAAGLLLAAIVVLPLGAVDAAAQIPDKFENLKLLPKDIGKQDLVAVMRNFSISLGMRCYSCHVHEDQNDFATFDWASDDNEHKRIARQMMQMVDEINSKQLAKTDVEDPTRVRCVTCHRGLDNPETLDNVLVATANEDGGDAAVEKYRMLRTKHYGSGSYDFSPRTLSTVAEQLAGNPERLDAAIAMMNLSLEHDPKEVGSHVLLGELLARKGDTDAAVASVKRALEIDPENRWAKGVMNRLTAGE